MERDRDDILTLGRRLADSAGFRVVALDGREVGVLEHVRYKQHTDHPDEIVVRRRRFLRERFVSVPFGEVADVDGRSGRVYLAIPASGVGFGG
jgi:PRC-barrel domain